MRTQVRTSSITKPALVVVAILLALAALALAVLPRGAGADNDITTVLLTERAEFTDDVAVQIRNKFDGRGTDVINLRDASRVVVAEITIQPGAVFPWHTHPGPVVINIAEGDPDGAFVYVLASDCVERHYGVGQALIDAGGDNIHTAYNPSDTHETVVIATIFGVPEDGPVTLPVPGPDPDVCPLPEP